MCHLKISLQLLAVGLWLLAKSQKLRASFYFFFVLFFAAAWALALVAFFATLPEPKARERFACEAPLSALTLWTPSAGTEAFSPLNSMPVMRTAVNCWRCPISFLYCFLRLNLNTRILSPRPSSITSPVTRAPLVLVEKLSPPIARMSANSIAPSLWGVFSTLITSPGATRYCLPPERMTAYIEVSKFSPRVALKQQNFSAGAQVQGCIDARCFLVRMGTTGKLNDYNEFSRNRSRSSHPAVGHSRSRPKQRQFPSRLRDRTAPAG